MYMYYQQREKEVWVLANASERESLIRTKRPALVTALDLSLPYDEMPEADRDIESVHYKGEFYIDIDSDDIPSAIEQTQKLLVKVKTMGVDLSMLRIYATGKKGFHVFFPCELFMPKIMPNGVANLPLIYHDMAKSDALYVDDLDLRVYSRSKGRMLRCPNIKRDNGNYKVPVSAEEVFEMTHDRYFELVAEPRVEYPATPPVYNSNFGLLYSLGTDRVKRTTVKRKGVKKAAAEKLKRFEGEWPNSMKSICDGHGFKPEIGWNQICMQIAITGVALDMKEEKILEDAEGVIASHDGDSDRYGSAHLRRRDLRNMIRSVQNNGTYEFSAGAILALLTPEAKADSELYDADTKGEADFSEDEGEVVEENQPSRVDDSGIYLRNSEGDFKRCCPLGFAKIERVCKANDELMGYEVDLTLNSFKKGRKLLPSFVFSGRSGFHNWALTQESYMTANDIQTGTLIATFGNKASARKQVTAMEREGLDVIKVKVAEGQYEMDVVWCSKDDVRCLKDDRNYRFFGLYSDKPEYDSDLMSASDLTTGDAQFFDTLFRINTPLNLAKMLGWFSAAFITQLVRHLSNKKFPTLQVFGQAGAGKSQTIILLNHLHYWQNPPHQWQVSNQTPFALLAKVATSASFPVVFEEVKPRQMDKKLRDLLQSMLRSNYSADQVSRGSLGRTSQRDLQVINYPNGAPIVFVGEALEDQTALAERCVVVALSKTDRIGKDADFKYCTDHATTLGKLGKQMAINAIATNLDGLRKSLVDNEAIFTQAVKDITDQDAARPSFNLGVVLTGLDFLGATLKQVFGTRYDEKIEELRNTLITRVSDSIIITMSEVAKVLDLMAFLTRNGSDSTALRYGIEYTMDKDKGTIDLKLRPAFDRYVRHQREIGQETLFDNYTSFQASVAHYGGTLQKSCPDNKLLFDSNKAIIMRLDTEFMAREGVDNFEPARR